MTILSYIGISPKDTRMNRWEKIVEKLLAWYRNPQNFRKPLKQAAEELGYRYDYLRKAVSMYGAEKFRQQRNQICHEILDEAVNMAVSRLHEMLHSQNDEEFRRAQREIREWVKTLRGEKVDVRNQHEGEVQVKIIHEVVHGATSDVVPEDQKDPG